MKKKFCIFIICMVLVCAFSLTQAHAHPSAGDHWKDIRYVLFGQKEVSDKDNNAKQNRQSLEYASQICIDQFQGSHSSMLKLLQDRVPRLCSIQVKDIDQFANAGNHRELTHKGWDYPYTSKTPNDSWAETNWPKRKELLLATAENIFNFNGIPDFADPLLGYDARCNSFCALLYYIHLIGDHQEFSSTTFFLTHGGEAGKDQVIPLGSTRGDSIVSEILKHCKTLFPEQQFSEMERELLQVNTDVCSLLNNIEVIKTEDGFKLYHEQTVKVLEILHKHIPEMLKNESFFRNVFY